MLTLRQLQQLADKFRQAQKPVQTKTTRQEVLPEVLEVPKVIPENLPDLNNQVGHKTHHSRTPIPEEKKTDLTKQFPGLGHFAKFHNKTEMFLVLNKKPGSWCLYNDGLFICVPETDLENIQYIYSGQRVGVYLPKEFRDLEKRAHKLKVPVADVFQIFDIFSGNVKDFQEVDAADFHSFFDETPWVLERGEWKTLDKISKCGLYPDEDGTLYVIREAFRGRVSIGSNPFEGKSYF